MRSVKKIYVDTPSGQVHCRISSGTASAILFLHQTASSSRCYEQLMKRLAVPNKLVAIDTPGFGESFEPSGWPSVRAYCRTIMEVMDGLGADRFHIFGHHTGATFALEIAGTWPQRTQSIVLAGVPFMSPREREELAAEHGKPLPIARDGSHLLANWSMPPITTPTARWTSFIARSLPCFGPG